MTRGGGAFHGSMSGNTASSPTADFFDEAACKGTDTAVFFPVSETFAGEAKEICAACPVAGQCLDTRSRPTSPTGSGAG